MSRFEWEGDYESPPYRNADEMFAQTARTAIYSKRGRKALAELREALMALPKHELIEGAVCRVKRVDEEDPDIPEAFFEAPAPGQIPAFDGVVIAETTVPVIVEGVCAVGAWVWWKKVKAGVDPVTAFTELPTLDSEDEETSEGLEMFETAWLGQRNGLTHALAWELASGNDERFASLSPRERWQAFVDWIDGVIAAPPLTRQGPVPKVHERLGQSWTY